MICPFWLEFVCNEKRDSHGLNQFLTDALHMPTCPSSSNTTNYLSLINTANILLSHIALRICKNQTRIIYTGYDYWILINILLFYLWMNQCSERYIWNGTNVILYTTWLHLKQYSYSWYSTLEMYNTDFAVEVLAYSPLLAVTSAVTWVGQLVYRLVMSRRWLSPPPR